MAVPKGGAPFEPPGASAGEKTVLRTRKEALMARAKKPRKTSQTEAPAAEGRVYSFRLLTDADMHAWDSKIAASGMKISEFMREAVIRNEAVVVGVPPKSINPDLVRQNYLLAALSRNMNQIAHRINSDNLVGLVTPAVYAAILEELESISSRMKDLD